MFVSSDRLHTEMMSDNNLALIFPSLKENEAGTYTCQAEYSNTQTMTKSVQIETVGRFVCLLYCLTAKPDTYKRFVLEL